MASKKNFYARASSSIYPTPPVCENSVSSDHTLFEFDESEVWNSFPVSSSFETNTNKKMVPSSRASSKKSSRKMDMSLDRTSGTTSVTCVASLPLNIPDWSTVYRQEDQKKIMHGNCLDHDQDNSDDYDDDHGRVDQDYRVPPHEFLARRRGASFSVHEGIGRTLKGRDLRQVRNAIWKKVGFED